MTDLTDRLLHLVALNEPENGGPYQGIAAQACMQAMREAADALDSLQAEVERRGALIEPLLLFVNKAGGTMLGLAMSGYNHPNPDEVMLDLARESMDLASRASEALPPVVPSEINHNEHE